MSLTIETLDQMSETDMGSDVFRLLLTSDFAQPCVRMHGFRNNKL